MGLVGKLEAEILILAPADKFHEVWGSRPHHMSSATPGRVQKVDLHEGDWGNVGSVIEWSYVLDGKSQVAKEIVEAIDKENKMVTFKIIEGDPLKEYKSFRVIVQAISKGEATLVRWTFEYEKLNKEIPIPVKLLEFVIHMSEELDDHLIQA
ncbi:MLP-like protein 34 [Vitis riparia]|uniref:MLP-like protein 34 n=1 Tax=Vitis riparia TaxID=96939 RepID=UPI00155B066D|nr:MLP-like protein 34 [Vitis riparia]